MAKKKRIKKRSKLKRSTFAIPSKRKYPIPDIPHARNAVARVNQHGSPQEKSAVYAAIRRKFPAFAKRSTVIPTRTGEGRHHGQPKGKTNPKRKKS